MTMSIQEKERQHHRRPTKVPKNELQAVQRFTDLARISSVVEAVQLGAASLRATRRLHAEGGSEWCQNVKGPLYLVVNGDLQCLALVQDRL